MKKLLSVLILMAGIYSCNSNKKPEKEPGADTAIERLKQQIDDIHIEGMSKMASLTKLQQETRRIIDSLNSKGSKGVEVVRARFDSLLSDLSKAEARMESWMTSFYTNPDTLSDNETERTKYLESQRTIATEIRDAIARGIQKADSLIKAKF